MPDRIEFLKQSLKSLRATGSITRSSRYLSRAMARQIDPAKAGVVVELGAGDGVVTQYLLDRMPADSQLLVFEINPVFIQKLRDRFDDPRIRLIPDSAAHLSQHLDGVVLPESVDFVVSAIPFAILPEALVGQIMEECHSWLRPGGKFIQFHYSPHMKKFYRSVFGNAHMIFIPLNIPPAFLITCEKLP